jgi:hypothetical protein
MMDGWTEGQVDMAKLIIAFRSFGNAHNDSKLQRVECLFNYERKEGRFSSIFARIT